MPLYQYTAMDANGKEQKGRKEAKSEELVAAFLKEQGMFPTSIKVISSKSAAKSDEKEKKGLGGKEFNLNLNIGGNIIKKKDLTVFTRQLAILLDAGLPLIRALRTLEHQAKKEGIKNILSKVGSTVEGGATFTEALAQHPRSFNDLYLNMVRAGEASGKMETILSRLAEFMEKSARIVGKVKSALVYPVIVLFIAVVITTFLMIYIVPKFKEIFDSMLSGQNLPEVTQLLITVSHVMQEKIVVILIVIAALVIGVIMLNKTKKGKYAFDFIKYRMPLFGPIIARSSISKFARTLGTLMDSGVPILNALQIVRDTAGNDLVSNAVQQVHDAVKEGEPIAAPLAATKIFPEMVISMIEVGEETGKLPDMLYKIAETYDEEVDNAVSALTSIIEPLMIVFLAVIVGGIVLALFMPLIKIIETLGA